jgi:hypothetical protein
MGVEADMDRMSEDEEGESGESEEELDEEGQVARAKTLAAALKQAAPPGIVPYLLGLD